MYIYREREICTCAGAHLARGGGRGVPPLRGIIINIIIIIIIIIMIVVIIVMFSVSIITIIIDINNK